VEEKNVMADKAGEPVDYVTFVSDGEPTLDVNLGDEIDRLKLLGIKVAVITNASMIWLDDVREDLMKADWVSVKIDSVREEIWQKINRPHKSLKILDILDGILKFYDNYNGKLVTETMLVHGVNDGTEHLKEIADFLVLLSPYTSYLSVPIRPPAEKWVKPPTEEALIRAYQILISKIKDVEYLIGYEGNAFAFTGDVERDLLSITAVHPMREEAVTEFLSKAETDWRVVDKLIDKGMLVEKEFHGKKFYARKLFAPRGVEMLGLRIE
jgi:wyosine [tRNA(Phe)-imidazoG37] synthetase (radical SAM superfamily)